MYHATILIRISLEISALKLSHVHYTLAVSPPHQYVGP